MMDKRAEIILARITERVYNEHKHKVFLKRKNFQAERAQEVLASKGKELDKKTRLLFEGFAKAEDEDYVDKKAEAEMNKHLDAEIEKAMRSGLLPKMTKDDFIKKRLYEQRRKA